MWLGDFNVRKKTERLGGNGIHVRDVTEFNDCLFNIRMDKMLSTGFFYTRDNKREGEANI